MVENFHAVGRASTVTTKAKLGTFASSTGVKIFVRDKQQSHLFTPECNVVSFKNSVCSPVIRISQ